MEGNLNRIKDNNTRNGTVITVWYLFCAVTAMIWILRWGIAGRTIISCLFLFFLTLIAECDIRTMRIPDRLVIVCGAAGLLSVPFFPEISLADRGLGMAGVSILLLCITLLAPGSFGGGDIKLMAASGLFLGWEGNLRAFSLAVFTAGAFCLWMLLWGKLERKARISFAPFICAGILMQITGSGCLW